jgi:rhodanese-related sulfurtransferase
MNFKNWFLLSFRIQSLSIVLFFCLVLAIINISCNQPRTDKEPVATATQEIYQCIPCGYDCDKQVYDKAGQYPNCHMELVKQSSIVFKTIQPSEICAYIKSHPNVVLLDVRTKEEFEGKAEPNFGTLKNAINLPIQEFDTKVKSLDSLKNKEIIVFCSHSHRSPRASHILTQNGFTNVTNMAGGMSVLKNTSCKN